MTLIQDFSQLARLIDPLAMRGLYHFRPIDAFSIDSRAIVPGCAYIALKGAHKDGHEFIRDAIKKGACAIICERDILPRPHVPFFIVGDSYQALARITSYVRRVKKPYVCAITGSIGKTTTKEMLSAVMAPEGAIIKNYKTENNLLGVAKTIFSLRDEPRMVLELGTNHPGEIAQLSSIVRPQLGVVTFVKPVHLEGFGSLRGVCREKMSLFTASPGTTAVLNRDDACLKRITRPKKIIWFGMSRSCSVRASLIKTTREESVFLINGMHRLRLASPFEGFVYNALAALAASSVMGVRLGPAVARLSSFREFPSQRLQITRTKDYLYINDAYNSNPYALQESLKMLDRFPEPKIAVLGDMLELGEKSVYYHTQAAKLVLARKFDHVYTVGECMNHLAKALKKSGYRRVSHCENSSEIARAIRRQARRGSLIFLKGSRKMELEKVMMSLSSGQKSTKK